MPMGRGLDHVVHAVRDLDAAADLYRRLGFQVGARNRHPWGTHNRLVQFDGFFIEILTFAEPDKLGQDGFSNLFAAYNRDFAAAHEGLSMIILESRDPDGDAGLYERAGICASPVMRFEREGTRPDGSRVKVGFSLVFAEDPNAPKIHFATCQQHHPENFWNPDFQRHANGATAIAEAVVVADDPKRHREAVRAFTGAAGSAPSGAGYTYALMRGDISLTTPAEFSGRYGVASPETEGGARIAALRFEVADPAALEALLARACVPYRRRADALVIPPEAAFGATLLFSPAG
jgi:catechol 2,3-dioxygenase-like lactoylglutathione lyase family enzyme